MRIVVIAAAVVCGAAVGFVIGALVGVAVPNEVLPPGLAALVLGLAGAVGFPVLAARALPATRRRGGTPGG